MIINDLLIYGKDKMLLRKQASILMYHSVSENSEFFTVRQTEFEWQMKYLHDHKYNVVSLENLVSMVSSGEYISDKTVVITFDDGYEDNYTTAFPVLVKYHFPAAIFLATGRLGDKSYRNKRNISMPMLDWEQIMEMNNSGLVDFEPHTVSHPRLSKISIEKARYEIAESVSEIESLLNKKCPVFCLPYGDYSEEVLDEIKNRFLACVTVEKGFVSSSDDLFRLKRHSVDSVTSRWAFRFRI